MNSLKCRSVTRYSIKLTEIVSSFLLHVLRVNDLIRTTTFVSLTDFFVSLNYKLLFQTTVNRK